MAPLRIENLPADIQKLCAEDPRFQEWILLSDAVARAEKISSWTQWTPAEAAAWEADDWRTFSRLRGYTDAEIAQFGRWLELTEELDSVFGEGFCQAIDAELFWSVETPALIAIKQQLQEMADAARNLTTDRSPHP